MVDMQQGGERFIFTPPELKGSSKLIARGRDHHGLQRRLVPCRHGRGQQVQQLGVLVEPVDPDQDVQPTLAS
jgi:hypothetical protein